MINEEFDRFYGKWVVTSKKRSARNPEGIGIWLLYIIIRLSLIQIINYNQL